MAASLRRVGVTFDRLAPMTEIGIVCIVVIVFAAGKLGHDWKPERRNLELALYSFVASIASAGLVALNSGQSPVRFFLFVSSVGEAVGVFFLVKAAFGIVGGSSELGSQDRPRRESRD